jgi:transposase-like protein
MPRKGHSEEQIVYALRQVEGGKKVSEVCREIGVSPQEFAQAAMQRSFGLSAAERPNDSTQDAVCVERLK